MGKYFYKLAAMLLIILFLQNSYGQETNKIDLPTKLTHQVNEQEIEYMISKSSDNELFLSGRMR